MKRSIAVLVGSCAFFLGSVGAFADSTTHMTDTANGSGFSQDSATQSGYNQAVQAMRVGCLAGLIGGGIPSLQNQQQDSVNCNDYGRGGWQCTVTAEADCVITTGSPLAPH
jgi:hypothetical protein